MNRKLVIYGALALAIILLVVISIEPFGIVPGFVRGEPFHRFLPVRYWREQLRLPGANREMPQVVMNEFLSPKDTAKRVLVHLIADHDTNVRWAALVLLGNPVTVTPDSVNVFVKALTDKEVDVQFAALSALRQIGPKAVDALPQLMELWQQGSDDEIRLSAERAVWNIAPDIALGEAKWISIEAKPYGVFFEGPPVFEIQAVSGETPFGPSKGRAWLMHHGPCIYTLGVIEFPAEFVANVTLEDRLTSFGKLADSLPNAKGSVLKRIDWLGLAGVEFSIEDADHTILWSRKVWDGDRLIFVDITFKRQFFMPKAVAAFIDSVKLKPTPEDERTVVP